MLICICPSRLSQNPFQNNKNCESCITTIYQLEIPKIYIRQYLPFSQHNLPDLCLLYLNTMNGVISWCLLALQLQLLSVIPRSGLLQPLVFNITSLVQFGKNLSISSARSSQNYFLQNISVKLLYQFLYPNNDNLFFGCLAFEEERNENKERNSGGAASRQLP